MAPDTDGLSARTTTTRRRARYALVSVPLAGAVTLACLTPASAALGVNPTFNLGPIGVGTSTNNPTPTFTIDDFQSDAPVASVTWEIDGDSFPWLDTDVPFTTPPLADGPHVVSVSVADDEGDIGVATVPFTVDTVEQPISIAGAYDGDEAPVLDGGSSSSTEIYIPVDLPDVAAGTVMRGALDGSDLPPVADTYHLTNLAPGTHQLDVTVTDPAGNVSTATFTWTVTASGPADVTAPTITGWSTKPDAEQISELPNAGFVWYSDDPTALWYASLDGSEPALTDGLTASYADLESGEHTWTVYGVDEAGNQSEPYTVTWTIDLGDGEQPSPAPVLSWVTTPAASSTSRSAHFVVSATEGAQVEYVLDLPVGAQSADAIPVEGTEFTLNDLSVGHHKIQVSATKGGQHSEVLTYEWDVTAPVEQPRPAPPLAQPSPLPIPSTDLPSMHPFTPAQMAALVAPAVRAQVANGIHRGASGQTVQVIQIFLDTEPDGLYGPLTTDAVRAFQCKHGLTIDGIVGPQTYAVMVALANGEAVATPGVPAAGSVAPSDIKEGISFGDRGEDVKVIQRVVGETPDGYFGSRTYAAVRQWQRFNGLVDDGIVGPLTWARMTHQS